MSALWRWRCLRDDSNRALPGTAFREVTAADRDAARGAGSADWAWLPGSQGQMPCAPRPRWTTSFGLGVQSRLSRAAIAADLTGNPRLAPLRLQYARPSRSSWRWRSVHRVHAASPLGATATRQLSRMQLIASEGQPSSLSPILMGNLTPAPRLHSWTLTRPHRIRASPDNAADWPPRQLVAPAPAIQTLGNSGLRNESLALVRISSPTGMTVRRRATGRDHRASPPRRAIVPATLPT